MFSLLSTNSANKKKEIKKYEINKGVLSLRFSAERPTGRAANVVFS